MFRWLFAAILFSLWAAAAAAQEESQTAIVEFVANDLNHGQKFVQITGDGDVLVTPKVLEQLRLKPELWAGHDGEQISLRALAPELQFTFSENDARVVVSVPLRWYDDQVIIPESPPPTTIKTEPVFPEPMAGFLNYNVRANLSEREGLESMELPLEIGFNREQWLALNTSTTRYDAVTGEEKTLRQRTTLFWDDQDNLRSLVLGDFAQPFGYMLGGGSYGGIAWRKNYGINRSFRRTADLGIDVQIESPTHAELIVNGRVAEEWDLYPGIVRFPDLTAFAIGDAELVLTDAFGRVRRLEIPSHTSQSVLRKSLHDYAYGFGWQRERPGEKSADYGRAAAVGYHRYGFGSTWSGGMEFALTADSVALGPSVVMLIGGFSQAELAVVASRDATDRTGYTATGRYGFGYKATNGFLSVTTTSRDYVRLPAAEASEALDDSKTRLSTTASLSYATERWGSFGISYMENHNWNEAIDPVRMASLNYRKQLPAGFHLTLGLRHGLDSEENDEAFLMLRYRPMSSRFTLFDNAALVSRSHQTNGSETELSMQRSAPRGLGWGYSTSLVEKEGDLFGNARGEYRNQRGIYTASVARSDQFTGSVTAAGGFAVLGGEIYSGPPVADSFAVVRLEGVESATIANGSAVAGVATAEDGLLVSDLSSYGINELAIDDPNLSLNYTSGKMRQVVEVGQRSGSLVTFSFSRFTAVDGELYLAAEGEEGVLEYVPIEYTVNGEKQEAFVGQSGYFYLENIPTGKQVLRIRRWGGDCLATIEVPETEKIVVSVGRIACVPESAAGEERPE